VISEILVLVLSFILISLVSGNNLPVCSGSIIGSRIISRRNGILLTITGYVAGLLLEGNLIRKGTSAILPFISYKLSIIALSIGIIVFLISHKMRVPQSLSVNFTSILIGISLAIHLKIDWYFVMFIIIFWILAPIISIITIRPFMSLSYRISNGKRIWNVVKWV
jgi:PiT family inorganic phosphate transporter